LRERCRNISFKKQPALFYITDKHKKGEYNMNYDPYPLHKMKVFGNGRSIANGNLSHSEEATESVLSLPMEPLQKMEDTSYVVDCIKGYFRN
jgi:dTDP-4-amino-4,6-dideoxygalactose transaminase